MPRRAHAIVAAALVAGLLLAGATTPAQSPTWTTPRTWVTGAQLNAGDLNVHLRDNLLSLRNAVDTLDLTPSGLAPSPSAMKLYRGDDTWYEMLDANGRVTSSVLAAGTPQNGQVLLYDSADGRAEWSYPFEFPRVRSGRDVAASTSGVVPALTATIHLPLTTPIVNAEITGTMTRVGSAACIIRFGRASVTAQFGTTVVDGNFTVTASSRGTAGSAVPIIALVAAQRSGTTCTLAAGALLVVST